jgi:hypothetical protein
MSFGFRFIIPFCFAFSISKGQTDSIPDRLSWDKSKKNSKELAKLLTDPFDLQAFNKLKKGRSNNGGHNERDYFYKPKEKGFYYYYFVFNYFEAHGPRVVVYQKGDKIGGYMDTAEVFIQVSSDRPDKDLGKLDLAGLSKPELIKKYGDNYIKNADTIAYQNNGHLLLLIGSKKVDWFKVTKLSKPFKTYEEISKSKFLLSYNRY